MKLELDDNTAHPTGMLGTAIRILSQTLSRRAFVKVLVGAGVGVSAGGLLGPQSAFACGSGYCIAPCGCVSEVSCCCSPNGLYCYYKRCSKSFCSAITGGVRAWIDARNDGTVSHGCINGCDILNP